MINSITPKPCAKSSFREQKPEISLAEAYDVALEEAIAALENDDYGSYEVLFKKAQRTFVQWHAGQ